MWNYQRVPNTIQGQASPCRTCSWMSARSAAAWAFCKKFRLGSTATTWTEVPSRNAETPAEPQNSSKFAIQIHFERCFQDSTLFNHLILANRKLKRNRKQNVNQAENPGNAPSRLLHWSMWSSRNLASNIPQPFISGAFTNKTWKQSPNSRR